MSKKILIIASIVLAIIAILLGGYYWYMKSQTATGENGGFINKLFPFGGGSAAPTPLPEGDPETPTEQVDFTRKIRRLSSEPVSGAGVFNTSNGSLVRYMETATGHIYETNLFDAFSRRVSNSTIPKPYDAVWTNSTSTLFARYLQPDNSTVNVYALFLSASTSSRTQTGEEGDFETISGASFPQGIIDMSIFGSSLFYLERTRGGSVGVISDSAGKNRKQIWSSPLYELIPQYVNKNMVTLTTKPEQNINGYMYSVNITTGGVTKLLGPLSGLSASVSPDGQTVLITTFTDSAASHTYSVKNKTYTPVSPILIPEKCVWSVKDPLTAYCAVPEDLISGNSLTLWYKGFVSFSDQIWKYDLKENTSSIAENFSSQTDRFDIIKPALSEDERYFVFINKKDGSLWSVDLSQSQ